VCFRAAVQCSSTTLTDSLRHLVLEDIKQEQEQQCSVLEDRYNKVLISASFNTTIQAASKRESSTYTCIHNNNATAKDNTTLDDGGSSEFIY
jgi:post-segregation antitoxin (ccd killing protein)